MEYRTLGKTGLRVSVLGFGCGNVGGLMIRGEPAEQRGVVSTALEAGVTYFDTAPSYGAGRSEENLGRTLRDLSAWGKVVVGTKLRVSASDLGDLRAAVRRSVQESLRRLGHDSVDLVQLHNRILPKDSEAGDGLAADLVSGELADAMRDVVREGLVRHVGITGMGETRAVKEVVDSGRFDTVQAYFNALNPSAGFSGASGGAQDFGGLIDVVAAAGLGILAIRVMAAGALSGSVERARLASPAGGGALVQGGEFQADVARARGLSSLAGELGLENTQELGFRFVLSKTGPSSVLVGFSDPDQLESATRWTERGPLTAVAVERVVAAARSSAPAG